ncbi:MAG: hypothetical protein KIT69_20105, partial [Propionibacteriaceae bacterium]|nr:hypothetical protein [Propionibacteriaceae bacterium]
MSGTTTLNTNVASVTTVNGNTNSLSINELNNISILAQNNIGALSVSSVGGAISLDAPITVTSAFLQAGGTSGIALNGGITSSGGVTINSQNGISQSTGVIAGTDLLINFVNGPVTLATNVNTVNAFAGGQTLTVNEANAITVNGAAVGSLFVNTTNGSITTGNSLVVGGTLSFNAGGSSSDILLNHDITGNTAVSLTAADQINQSAGVHRVAGGAVSLAFGTTGSTLRTNVTSMTSNAAGQSLVIDESNGISLLGQTLGSLSVTTNGLLSVDAPFSVATTTLTANGGAGAIDVNGAITATTLTMVASTSISLDANVSGSTSVALNAGSTITQSSGALVSGGGALSLTFTNGPVTLATNVGSLTANGGTAGLIVNEANGLDLLGMTLGALTVNAGLTGAGGLSTFNAISVTGNLLLDNNGGG